MLNLEEEYPLWQRALPSTLKTLHLQVVAAVATFRGTTIETLAMPANKMRGQPQISLASSRSGAF